MSRRVRVSIAPDVRSRYRQRLVGGGIYGGTVLGSVIESPAVSVTQAELADIADEINTTGKYRGKTVFVSDQTRFAQAVGPAAGDIWVDAGVTIATPV